jgi:hypothetical protein
VFHNLLQPDGKPATDDIGSELLILNYPKGTKEIREQDDPKVVFSSLNEDNGHDIAKGLKAIGDLDPDSYISFVIEREGSNAEPNEYGPYAWSHLYKVKDMIKGLKKVDLSICSQVDMRGSEYGILQYSAK